ncbi:MAG: ABC transporter ATP-binding protein [Verrucomicrobiae bacterium]|nr:ABC transporter ATP-binding protein [Verrucomicrobiae bacterium]
MGRPIISVRGLGKRYQLGATPGHDTLRDHLAHALAALQRRWRRRNGEGAAPEPAGPREIWALREVSFDVMPGEVVGVIGRNGAGKSTLLKILSRITDPTEGEVRLRGRTASLLEVGTGFHPELTGRENIFLNGAILGMTQAEIRARFDEIVAFADIGPFLDTPVKRYSSGMYTRLAFAVAAHLQPEILVVDEVLAVGDAAFQKKCLNKMQDIGRTGRTILFVSHNLSAITRLCQRAIWLHQGRVMRDGPAAEVASAYLNSGIGTGAERTWPDGAAPGNTVVRLVRVRVRREDGTTCEAVDIREPVGIETEYEVLTPDKVLVPNYHFYNEEGVCVFISHDVDPAWRHRPKPCGRYRSTAWVPGNFLAEGRLTVNVAISTYRPFEVHVHERDAVAFTVVDNLSGETARGDYAGKLPGVVRPLLRWQTEVLES